MRARSKKSSPIIWFPTQGSTRTPTTMTSCLSKYFIQKVSHITNIYKGLDIPYHVPQNTVAFFLFQLRSPIYMNSYVSIALLPRQDASIDEGQMCRVSGWGLTSAYDSQIPSTLLTVKVPIVSTQLCNSSDSYNGNITHSMICAGFRDGGKDSCKVRSHFLYDLAAFSC